MIEFDVSTPLDFNKALDKISNKNKTIYYKFLIIFINDTLFKSLRDTTKPYGYQDSDLKNLYLERQSLNSQFVTPIVTQDELFKIRSNQ